MARALRILALSGDMGSTYLISKHLQQLWREEGHAIEVISPVRRRWNPRAIWHALTHLRDYDVIHTHLGSASILGRWIAFFLNIPCVATLHGFQRSCHYSGIRHFTAVSEAVKRHFVTQGIAEEKITVIPNGYDPRITQKPPSLIRTSLPDQGVGRFVIGSVGSLSPVKRHESLIEAMATVVAKAPQAMLLIAGSGDLEAQLRAKIDALSLNNHVILTGYLTDIAPFYHSLDLYAQASHREGFCLPLLEAMACGVPVISAANEGPQEFITDGQTGSILPDASPQHLADAILRTIADPAPGKHMAEHAKVAIAPMTWHAQSKRYLTLFESIV